MAKGNEIVVAAEPGGRFDEGFVDGALKPGTIVCIKAATAAVGGKFTWEAYDATLGRAWAVLCQDWGQGKLNTTAYASGDRCFLYFPQIGDRLNILVDDVTGTGDDVAIDDVFHVKSNGLLEADLGTGAGPFFTALEAVTDPTADFLLYCSFSGF